PLRYSSPLPITSVSVSPTHLPPLSSRLPPPPPRSTLFPYTTLFRSGSSSRTMHPPRLNSRGLNSIGAARPHPVSASGTLVASEPDRKSTRLNSSHDQISYAVFCLKKKNRASIRYITPRNSPAVPFRA